MVNAGFVTSQPDDHHIFNYFILLIKTETIKLLDNLKVRKPIRNDNYALVFSSKVNKTTQFFWDSTNNALIFFAFVFVFISKIPFS